MHRRNRNEEPSEDSPPYSRLFIVCGKRYKEEDFEEAFSKYGTIENIRMPRDFNTGEAKGVVYIKFSKTSEAANALEEMSNKSLRQSDRPLRVMVAANRSDIQSQNDRWDYDPDRFNRLFITVPKVATEDEILEVFNKYGYVNSVLIQRDRNTGEAKGFAYVRYRKFSEAANGYEQCPKEYRATFALPKLDRKPQTSFEHNINSLASTSNSLDRSQVDLISMMDTRSGGYTKINFMCSPCLSKMHVEYLFDIVPGMVDCHYLVDLMRNCGKGYISYSNPISAAYAVRKLNEFEYPPGMKIFVRPWKSKFDEHEQNFNRVPEVTQSLSQAVQAASNSATPDLAKLTEAIAEASKLIKMVTTGVTENHDSSDLNYCSVALPPPQPLADIDDNVAKRCFLVCKPQPPPLTVLRDIFCRFGDLINVYTLPNKTVGYARYSSVKAADEAIKTLHGAEVCGVRIKVLEAEDENPAKRRRFEKGD